MKSLSTLTLLCFFTGFGSLQLIACGDDEKTSKSDSEDKGKDQDKAESGKSVAELCKKVIEDYDLYGQDECEQEYGQLKKAWKPEVWASFGDCITATRGWEDEEDCRTAGESGKVR